MENKEERKPGGEEEQQPKREIQSWEWHRESILGSVRVLEVQPLQVMPVERQRWANNVEFLLSSLAYAVGFGTMWRFPYFAYRYGGGSFLIAFTFFLVIIAVPLYVLEAAAGQYAGLGPYHVYNHMCPGLRGLGIVALYISLLSTVQFSFIIGLAVRYIIDSLNWTLPWGSCDLTYSVDGCLGPCYGRPANSTYIVSDGNCQPSSSLCSDANGTMTCTSATGQALNVHDPASSWFYENVLDLRSDDGSIANWSHYGYFIPEAFGCFGIAYYLCLFSLRQGVSSLGKVVYFLALFPFVVLTALLIRMATLPGFSEGVGFFLHVDTSSLFSLEVWYQALGQVLYSMAVGFGGLMTLSSYNNFNAPLLKASIGVTVANWVTCVYAGVLIFGTLGHIAHATNQSIAAVGGSGSGLTFVAIPTALTLVRYGPTWSFVFFIMLFALGLGKQTAEINTMVTALLDEFEWCRKRRAWTATIVVGVSFLASLTMVFQGALWFNILLNDYAVTAPVMIFSFGNVVAFVYFFGFDRFWENIEEMLGHKRQWVQWYFWVMWMIVTPLVLLLSLLAFLFTFKGSYYGYPMPQEPFPPGVLGFGYFIALVPVLLLLIGAAFEFYMTSKEHPYSTGRERTRIMFEPRPGFISQQEREVLERKAFLEAMRGSNPEAVVHLDDTDRGAHERTIYAERHSYFRKASQFL